MDSPPNFGKVSKRMKELMPSELGLDAWWLMTATVLICSQAPEQLGLFYKHLKTHEPEFSTSSTSSDGAETHPKPPTPEPIDTNPQTPSQQRSVSHCFADILLKCFPLIGAPQVLCALIPFAKAEAELDLELKFEATQTHQNSSSSPQPQSQTQTTQQTLSRHASDSKPRAEYHVETYSPAAITSRGVETITTIYGPRLLPKIFESFGRHTADVQFAELFGVYGMYLSDFSVLNPRETELVVFTAIASLGLKGPTMWHTRGMGRVLGMRDSKISDKDEMEGGGRTRVEAKGDITAERILQVLKEWKVAMIFLVREVGGEIMRMRTGVTLEEKDDEQAVGSLGFNVQDVAAQLGGWGDDEYFKQ